MRVIGGFDRHLLVDARAIDEDIDCADSRRQPAALAAVRQVGRQPARAIAEFAAERVCGVRDRLRSAPVQDDGCAFLEKPPGGSMSDPSG